MQHVIIRRRGHGARVALTVSSFAISQERKNFFKKPRLF